jgi:hypothetical protein
MKISGYKLREALRNKRTLRDVLATRFNETLFQFEAGAKPQDVAKGFQEADQAVAMLEEAQQFYNQQVNVEVEGKTMTLVRAIKLVGGAGRLEKMWRSAATDTGRDRYSSYREMSRKSDEEHARRMVSVDDAIELAQKAARFASALRSAIAEANARKVELNLSPDLIS